LSHLTKIPEKD